MSISSLLCHLSLLNFPRSAGAVALGNTFSAYGTRHNVATTHHGATTQHTTRCSVHNGCTHAKRSQTSCVGIRSHWKFHTARAHALAVAHTLPQPLPANPLCLSLPLTLRLPLSLSLSLPPCSVHVTRQQQQLMILRSARNVEFI